MSPRTVINIDDPVGRVVGRRRPPADPLQVAHSNQANAAAWMKALPVKLHPRGVFRFHTHEEANAWMTKSTTSKNA
jgi:hypothetical protein